jgi:hypothetical protein
MMLIYSREDDSATPEDLSRVAEAHRSLMQDAGARGVLRAAEPLERSTTATTLKLDGGKVLLTDGPFAETKEQLAGYYILDCQDLDEALEWAARIPTACQGSAGYVEVRPIRQMSISAV